MITRHAAGRRTKPNRKRNIRIHLWATKEEAALIHDRMARMGVTSISAYIRKMAIDGFFIRLDLSEIQTLTTLLRRCSNNLNQYAKRANEIGSIYAADIEDLRVRLDVVWTAVHGILEGLAQVK